ncbi:hypothetical protein [Ruegeria profundi]|uniref:hypothetical protein n=1 Tax=Ruegeria profundi TaxID=1685378 RepID=UPI003C7BC3AF
MSDKVEISLEFLVRLERALGSCVDELTAIHQIKYAHILETSHPIIQRKIQNDDEVRQSALAPLIELSDFLEPYKG